MTTSVILAVLAVGVFVVWLPFASGHPPIDGLPGFLLFLILPLVSAWLLFLAKKKRSRLEPLKQHVLSDQLFGPERSYPVARRGSIAWIRPALDKVNTEFLIDAFIFPGNSGGPVFKPCRTAASQGQIETDCLIGMVKAYMPYTDSAFSRQTGKVRVTFEENSGLAVVVPVESILRAIAEHLKTQ